MSLFPLVRAVDSSNMSYGHKSTLSNMVDRIVTGRFGMAPRVGQHVLATVNVLKEVGEAVVVGPGLAMIHATVGLDQTIPGTKTFIPMDLAAAIVAGATAIALPGAPGAHAAGEFAGKIGTVYGFRMMHSFLAAKRHKAGKKVPQMAMFGYEEGDSEWSNTSLGAEASQSLEESLKQL